MDKKIEYKGLYIQDKEQSITYYEYGAHFSYKALYNYLDLICKNNNKNIKVCSKKIFLNLKKSNSQKLLNNDKDKNQKINISRNLKNNRHYICDKIINNNKLDKSKLINKKLELSKSFNSDLFGSSPLISKNNAKTNHKSAQKYKDIKKKEILLKKNSENKVRKNILLLNNKNMLKNKHTVLKYTILPKKDVDKGNKLYGFSCNNNINDSDIYSYGNDSSFNSTGNNNNNYYYSNLSVNKINSISNGGCSSKYQKIKNSSIINKKYKQKLICDSPKNNSLGFIRNNTSGYYSKSQTQRINDNNFFNFTKKKKHNNSGVDFDNNNDNNNYYIENDSFNNYHQSVYNNIINKNILLYNNTKNKIKNPTIFNNYNKINFQKNVKDNYLNSFKNPLLLGEKIKILKTNRKNTALIKSNIIYSTTKDNSSSFLHSNKKTSKNVSIYNITSNNKNTTPKKRITKNNHSHNNISNKYRKKINETSHSNNNLESITFYIDEENNASKNKKSRNNNSKNIVNLLCCHFSINFNSPINLINNIQNNINNNNIDKIAHNINNKDIFNINNNNIENVKNSDNNNLNNISKSRNNKTTISKNKSIEKDDKKNKNKKIGKIPIKIDKTKINEKNKIVNYFPLNKKGNNSLIKKKFENNTYRGKGNNLIKRKNEQKISNNKIIRKAINKHFSFGLNKSSNSSNNYNMNNISTSNNLKNNNYQ